MSLLTYGILVCILGVKHGEFRVELLWSCLIICFSFNFLDALFLKVALAFMCRPANLLRLTAIAGYRFVGFSLVVLASRCGALVQMPVLAYIMFAAFTSHSRLIEEHREGAKEDLGQETVRRGVCVGHIVISLLSLWLTGGL